MLFALHETADAQQAYSRMSLLREILKEREEGEGPPELELLKNSYLMSYIR